MLDFIYIHNLSPFLIHTHLFGAPIGLRWYGLAYVVGLASAFLCFDRAAKRGLLPGLTSEAQLQMLGALIAGVLGGGRLVYVLQHPARLLADPLFFFRVWEGGMAFFGGLIGVALALIWTSRKFNLDLWSLADVAAFPAAFGLGVGRVANFVNGELWGRPTNANWGVIFPRVDNLPRHPSQLYEATSHFLLLGVLLWLLRHRPQDLRERPGFFAALFLALYGVLRFLTDFYRADDTFFGPFSSGQWASLVVGIIGLVLLARSAVTSKATTPISFSSQPNNHAQ